MMGVLEGVVKRHKELFKFIKRVHSLFVEKQQDLQPVVNEFQDVFVGIGKLPVVHDIKLATGQNFVDPVVCVASR